MRENSGWVGGAFMPCERTVAYDLHGLADAGWESRHRAGVFNSDVDGAADRDRNGAKSDSAL